MTRRIARSLLDRYVPELNVVENFARRRATSAATTAFAADATEATGLGAGGLGAGDLGAGDLGTGDLGAEDVCGADVCGADATGALDPWRASVGSCHGPRSATVTVHDARTYGAVLRQGTIGLGQSYVAGWWDADDLTAAVRTLLRGTTGYRRMLDAGGRAAAPVLDLLRQTRPPKPADDRANVRAHYDLPDEIFAAMLDETMAYSCAVFDEPGMSLADAQRAKFDRLCRKLHLGPRDHIVEIGSGWGGFAIHAASTYGCQVTTTTVSERQLVRCRERVASMGLTQQVTVLADDYRDLRGQFDALVSIEMVEAVDWRLHPTFLRTCRRLLHQDGRMGLQAIVIDDASEPRARHHADFIRAMVFPGSCIPSVSRLVTLAARAGLRTLDVDDIGDHYPTTLRHWRQNLVTAVGDRHARSVRRGWGTATAGRNASTSPHCAGHGPHHAGTAVLGDLDAALDEPSYRLWMLYLAYCEAAFAERHISDIQMVLTPGRWRSTPANRAMEAA